MKDNGIVFILAAALTAVVCLASADNEGVEFFIEPANGVKAGQTLLVTCRVPDRQLLDSVRLVRKIGSAEYEVATNNYLKEKYRETGRYWIQSWNERKSEMRLSITNVGGRDSGVIGCEHLPNGQSVFTEISVDVPVGEIEIYYEARDGDWYKAVEDSIQFESSIRCRVHVNGSETEPDVNILIGNKKLSSKMEKETNLEVIDDEGFKKIIHHIDYTIKLDGSDLRYHKKKLTCSAKAKQHPAVEKSILLEIPYKPQVACPRQWTAYPCEEKYRIICRSLMFPPLVNYTWTWKSTDRGQLMSINNAVPSFRNITRFHADYRINERGEYEFNLYMDEVKREDFTIYTLTLANVEGTTTVDVELTIDEQFLRSRPHTTFQPMRLLPSGHSDDSAHSKQVMSGKAASELFSNKWIFILPFSFLSILHDLHAN